MYAPIKFNYVNNVGELQHCQLESSKMTVAAWMMDISIMNMSTSEITNTFEKARSMKGWSKREMAAKANVPYSWIVDLYRNNPQKPDMQRVQKVLSVLGLTSTKSLVPVIGEVGAGGKIYSVDDIPLMPNGLREGDADYTNCETIEPPPGVYPSEVGCVKVKGNSMYPRYKDGEYLFFRQRIGPVENFLGEDCILELEDGQHLVKVLRRGDQFGHYNLESYNEPPILNAKVKWATPVEWSHKKIRHK